MPSRSDGFEAARRLFREGQPDRALEVYREALDGRNGDAGAWAEYGGLLLAAGRLGEAAEACERALRIGPEHPMAMLNSAHVLLQEGRLDEAEAMCRRAVALHPRFTEFRLVLAQCLLRKGDLKEAQDSLETVIGLEPENGAARRLLGEVFLRQGNWEEIRREMERQLDGCSGPTVPFERACLDLRFGDMPKGWQGYEARWQIPEFSEREQHYSQPRWEGEPFPGKTLLLFWEQGFGDTLMFVRYAALAKARGGRVLVAAQSQLADVIATCPGVDQVIPHGQPLPPFDLQAPLLSLPWIFRTDLESIPAEVPYLAVPSRVPNRGLIAGRMGVPEGHLRVGLAWAGSPTHKNDTKRSIPPEALSPLASLPGVAWFGFQVGRSEVPPFSGITSLEPLLSNFSDTIYALGFMDLVITVDSVLAHLAGAAGIPTLLLVSCLPDWRWLMGREDSPWYPTLRIYRQPSPGDWGAVVESLLADLTGDGNT